LERAGQAGNLSRPETADSRGSAAAGSAADLPVDEMRSSHLLEPEPSGEKDPMMSTYYTYMAGRLPEPDLWRDRLAIDLFGAGELPPDRGEADDSAGRTANSWSEDRIVTRSLGGDLDADSAGGLAMQGRLIAAFSPQPLTLGPYGTMMPAKTAEVPVRGFIQRAIRWAYQNPLLAGVLGGGFTLLLASIVSRNTVQGRGAKPA
jgi:hypothetical protein